MRTMLLGKPFAKPLFYFGLRNCALGISRLQTIPNFLHDIQVILDVLERTIVRQLLQQRFDLVLSSTHELKLPQNE